MQIRTKIYFISAGQVITGAIIGHEKNERGREYVSIILENGSRNLRQPLKSLQLNPHWMITDEKVDKLTIAGWLDKSLKLQKHFYEVYATLANQVKHFTAIASSEARAEEAVRNQLIKDGVTALALKTNLSKHQIQALNQNIIKAS